MNKQEDKQEIPKKIKDLLSEQLGIKPSDIQDDHSLLEDLHMGPSDLTDFSEKLLSNNIDISNIDFQEIDTVGNLIEALSSNEF